MRIVLTKPSNESLLRVADAQSSFPLTYPEAGASASQSLPSGYTHDRHSVILQSDGDTFNRAVIALHLWMPHLRAGMVVAANGSLARDCVIAMATPLPVAGYVIAACRVVYVNETKDLFEFGYGTLPIHPEIGEERFAIVRDGDQVRFEVSAFSRPNSLLAKLGHPIARVLQKQITNRYLTGMQLAVSQAEPETS